jgi:ligand-binding SRPBCC domain-containing protein
VTELPISPEAAFDLSLDVDVHTNSMAASREAAVAGVTRGRMALNDEVTWRAWHFGVPWRMSSRITVLQRPSRFVDEQVRGPFAGFRHEHVFEPMLAGTRMIDRIEFAAPLGWLGRVAERLVLAGYLRRLIERRNAYLVATAAEP